MVGGFGANEVSEGEEDTSASRDVAVVSAISRGIAGDRESASLGVADRAERSRRLGDEAERDEAERDEAERDEAERDEAERDEAEG